MYVNSIENIVELKKSYKGVYKIDIVDIDDIVLHWTDEQDFKKEFNSALEMIEWMDNNLEKI